MWSWPWIICAPQSRRCPPRACGGGLRLLYLPRYTPDLDSIEPGWSKVKTRLRARAARTIEALDAELGLVLDAITPQDVNRFFRHAGYALS
jgi:transposase